MSKNTDFRTAFSLYLCSLIPFLAPVGELGLFAVCSSPEFTEECVIALPADLRHCCLPVARLVEGRTAPGAGGGKNGVCADNSKKVVKRVAGNTV